MGNRRSSRELAMQALFFLDMHDDDTDKKLEQFNESLMPSKNILPFFNALVKGVIKIKPEIDQIIERFSKNWKISRMSCVDRNIIRIAVFEFLCCPDIPAKVSINEAIDMGKKFGTNDSWAFINGILDSINLAVENGDIKTIDE